MEWLDPHQAEARVQAVVEALPRADDATALDLLEEAAPVFVGWDLVHRLVPFAERLRGLDYTEHPWAAMPASVAICAIDRPTGRALLTRSRRHFEATPDHWATGLACYLEGLEDLGEGRVAEATRWWEQARALVDDPFTMARLTGAHDALGAYQGGKLDAAIALAEQALWAAEDAHDHRTQAVSGVYLAFFRIYVGAYASAEQAMARADAAFAEMADPENQYEMPLLIAERAVVSALRGDAARTEEAFTAAIELAAAMLNDWYRAIILSLRADFTAEAHPVRAVRDATEALAYFDSIDEQWWSTWARHALARAHLACDEPRAAAAACAVVLAGEASPVEKARILITRAEIEARHGHQEQAAADALDAARELERCGSRFWAARAHLLAATVDRRRREFHVRAARRLAAGDVDDPAWVRLLRGRGQVRIEVSGLAAVTVDGRPVRLTTRAELETLTMLALRPGGLATDVIGDRLWPDDDHERVRHRLDNLVSSLRRALLPTTRIRRAHGLLLLDLAPDECDLRDAVVEAEARLARPPARSGDPAVPVPRGEATPLGNASTAALVERLHRPLLAGHEAPWIGLESQRLRRLAARLEALDG